jgi:hypothetical protein
MGRIDTRYVTQPTAVKGLDGKDGANGTPAASTPDTVINVFAKPPKSMNVSGGTVKLDLAASRKFRITVTNNFTVEFNDVIEDGGKFSLTVIQGGAGGYVMTLPATVRWPNGNVAPTISDATGEHTTYGFEAYTSPPFPALKYDAFLIGTKI